MSDVWLRAVIGNTAPEFLRPPGQTEALGKKHHGWSDPAADESVSDGRCVSWIPIAGRSASGIPICGFNNRITGTSKSGNDSATMGNRVRRGDIWNPISFNEVYAPTKEIQFATLAADSGRRGWTIGAKGIL